MKKFLLPALVAGAVAMSGAAFAATTSTGVIKAMDMAKHEITLDNGTTYMLPKDFKDPGLKVGEKVSVSWDMSGGNHQATMVTITK